MDIERLIESVRSRKILYVTASKSSKKKKLGGTWLMKWAINAAAATTTSVTLSSAILPAYLCISFVYLLSSDVVRYRTTSSCV